MRNPPELNPARSVSLWAASTEKSFLKVLKMVVRRPSTLTVIRPPVQQILCIKFKRVCSRAVPMASVFRTPVSRRIGQESLWLGLNPAKTLRPLLQLRPG